MKWYNSVNMPKRRHAPLLRSRSRPSQALLALSMAVLVLFGYMVVLHSRAAATPPAVGFNWHAGWSSYSDADNQAIVDQMAAAHLAWARIDIGWCTVESDGKGVVSNWYISKLDTAIDYARSKGIKILGVYHCTPQWANGTSDTAVPPANPADYAQSAKWVAAHWRGRVAAWEVWNEPDPDQAFWKGTAAQYVQLLQAAYPQIKAGDPAALVVLGAPSTNNDAWIEQLYSLGAKGAFDVLATHPYQGLANAAPEQADDGNKWWYTHLPAVRNVMVKYGDSAKNIWFTEFGWSSHANTAGLPNWQLGVSEQAQGDYFVRAVQYAIAHYPYVTNLIWYTDRDIPGADIQNANYGLLRSTNAAKPALGTVSAYLAQLYATPAPSATPATPAPTSTPKPTPTATPRPVASGSPTPPLTPAPSAPPGATGAPVSGIINVPPSPGRSVVIKVDGAVASHNGTLDTRYLTNGQHLVTTQVTDAAGHTTTTTQALTVANQLTPWELVRNQLFAHFHGNKALIDRSTLALELLGGGLLAALGLHLGWRWWQRRRPVRTNLR